MQTEEVKILRHSELEKGYLIAKEFLILLLSLVMSLVFLPFIILVEIMIKIDSPGKIFFLQKSDNKREGFKIFNEQ